LANTLLLFDGKMKHECIVAAMKDSGVSQPKKGGIFRIFGLEREKKGGKTGKSGLVNA